MRIAHPTGGSRFGPSATIAGLLAAVAAAIAAAGVLGAALPTTLPGAATPGADVPSVVDDVGLGG